MIAADLPEVGGVHDSKVSKFPEYGNLRANHRLAADSVLRRLELIDWAVRRLIINADDFGLTRGVNRAVVELHQAGVLSSATLMAQAPATEDATQLALATPSLGVGCHVVLVDGEPVSNPSAIRTLVDPGTGRFYADLGTFMSKLLLGQIRPADIQAEAAAQIALLKNRGIPLTHIDTHKHTHMFPAVLRPLLRAAMAMGIRAVRNPFEPAWSRRATPHAPLARRMQVSAPSSLEPAFRRIVDDHGFTTTDGSFGVLATGTLNAGAISSLLQRIPKGTWELVTHPGYNDEDLNAAHTRLKASRETERQALAALDGDESLELISFAGLAVDLKNK
jgi:chitin disaccharide deacetylase